MSEDNLFSLLDGDAAESNSIPQAKYIADFPVKDIRKRERDHKIYTKSARDTVRESISQFGVIEPLVINEDNYLVHGGLRLEVIEELGITHIPVMVTKFQESDGVADLYHMLADRVVEWDKWDSEAAIEVLKELDGKELENGLSWRDFFKRIGFFIPDTSAKHSATNETLENLARETVKWSATKFNFNAPQLLYIEAFRAEIQKLREAMIARGEIDGGVPEKYSRHMKEEETKLEQGELIKSEDVVISELKDAIKTHKKPQLSERAKIQKKGASSKVHKNVKDGRMMDREPFILMATTFGGKTSEEAESIWQAFSVKEFNSYCREIINEDLKVDPPKSKVHPLAVGGK